MHTISTTWMMHLNENTLVFLITTVFSYVDCPLDMSWWNLTAAASVCSDQNGRAKCCRYINAFIAVSVAYYANATGELGVPSAFSDDCYNSISDTLKLSGIPSNATMFCGLGLKIHISYQCEGRVTISDMLQSPNFYDVIRNCKLPLSLDNSCKRCLNSGLSYLRHLVGDQDNVTLNTCRDAAFVALANQGENSSIIDIATCFFSVKGLSIHQGVSILDFLSYKKRNLCLKSLFIFPFRLRRAGTLWHIIFMEEASSLRWSQKWYSKPLTHEILILYKIIKLKIKQIYQKWYLVFCSLDFLLCHEVDFKILKCNWKTRQTKKLRCVWYFIVESSKKFSPINAYMTKINIIHALISGVLTIININMTCISWYHQKILKKSNIN